MSVLPAIRESCGICTFKSSTCPLANVSVLIADGMRSVRAISVAHRSSGFTERLSPRSSEMSESSPLYSGFRTRAIVCRAPIFFATRQQRRFSSSDIVTAMRRSAESTPASICVAYVAPFPSTHRISKSSLVCCKGSPLRSMIVISCPSRESCSASVLPILPSPTITIFIARLLFFL